MRWVTQVQVWICCGLLQIWYFVHYGSFYVNFGFLKILYNHIIYLDSNFLGPPSLKFCAYQSALLPLPCPANKNVFNKTVFPFTTVFLAGTMSLVPLLSQSVLRQEQGGKLCSRMNFTFGKWQMLFNTKSGEIMLVIKLDNFGEGQT